MCISGPVIFIQQKATREQKRDKKVQRSRRSRVDTWMSPEALQGGGEESRRKGGWVEGWAAPLSCSPVWVCMCCYVHVYVCVCTAHMCNGAGGVEQGVIPDGHTHK